MRRILTFILLTGIAMYPGILHPQPPVIPPGVQCAECGMAIDPNSRFISEVVSAEGKALFFCDVGDMLFHFRSSKDKAKTVSVRDFSSGQWIDGRKAFYVLHKEFRTPMSWGIAAFSTESAAKKWGAPVNFDGAFALVKR